MANYCQPLQTIANACAAGLNTPQRWEGRRESRAEYKVSVPLRSVRPFAKRVPLRSGEKIDAAYMAVFSRKPTAREKALCLQVQAQGLSTVEDLIYALINTRQFIFNQ